MLINQLSKTTGLSAHTIRYYEKCGFIKGKRKENITSNNYFHYDEETIDRLQLIRDAKSIGFSLAEIKHLLDAWYNNHFSVKKKLSILDDKIETIEKKIEQLKSMKTLVKNFKKTVMKDNC